MLCNVIFCMYQIYMIMTILKLIAALYEVRAVLLPHYVHYAVGLWHNLHHIHVKQYANLC